MCTFSGFCISLSIFANTSGPIDATPVYLFIFSMVLMGFILRLIEAGQGNILMSFSLGYRAMNPVLFRGALTFSTMQSLPKNGANGGV